jgi:hypothetical protein
MNNTNIDHKKPRSYTIDITPTWREALSIYSAVLLNRKADQEAIDNAWNGIQEAGLKLDRIIATYGKDLSIKTLEERFRKRNGT